MASIRIPLLTALASAGFALALAAEAGPGPTSNQAWDDPALRSAAEARGAAVYAEQCASCHGADLKGAAGAHAPDLTDDYWLFGGEDLDTFQIHPSDVELTVRYGVRSGHAKARELSSMPTWQAIAAKSDGLSAADMDDVTEYVLHLSGQQADLGAALRGKNLFGGKATCFDCHASDAKGDSSIGATDLTRPATWVYGSDRAAIRASMVEGRAAEMPAFADVLSDRQIADVSIYVLARAGGRDF